MLNLNDLLVGESIDPRSVLVLRHRPIEPEFNRVLPWLVDERPDIFNAYQQIQGGQLESVMESMKGNGYVASFIRHEAGQALFIGLYSIAGSKSLTNKQFWKIPANIEMRELYGIKHTRPTALLFDLEPNDFYAHWKGRLVIDWPPPERSWWRRAHRNDMKVQAILEDSALDSAMPEWDAIVLRWEELAFLPTRWRSALAQWRGIYYIFDSSDGRGYVGSAYGENNLLGRWHDYAARGHGGNRLLRQRDPKNFQFSILQRVSPDMDSRDVIAVETSWKKRLHTYAPLGLNDN